MLLIKTNHKKKIVLINMKGYTTMCGDLFHLGHIKFLEQAKKECDYLIVGLPSDKDIMKYKLKKPILNISERKEIIEYCKFVDEVIINVPYLIDDEGLKKLNADIFLYSTVDEKENKRYLDDFILTKKRKKLEYTSGISTSQLRKRVIEYQKYSL